jgi:hypothetical protein
MGTSEPRVHEACGNNEYVNPEPFVDDVVVAKFLSLTPGCINDPRFRKPHELGYLVDCAARLATLNH